MDSTEAAFFASILDDPDDKLRRLVLCDYWEENGQATFAQECRRQVEGDLAGMSGPIHPEYAIVSVEHYRPRGADLLLFWGGFPDAVRITAELFRDLDLNAFVRMPIRRIELADARATITLRREYHPLASDEEPLVAFRATVVLAEITFDRQLYIPGVEQQRVERVTVRERQKLNFISGPHGRADLAREEVLRAIQQHGEATAVPGDLGGMPFPFGMTANEWRAAEGLPAVIPPPG